MAIVTQQMKKVDDVERTPEEDTEQVTFKVDQEVQSTFQYDVCKKALCDFISAKMEELEVKDALECEVAKLRNKTDWGEALPLTSRPTVDDKKAYITEVTYEKKQQLRALSVDARYKEEIYKLELLRYEKE